MMKPTRWLNHDERNAIAITEAIAKQLQLSVLEFDSEHHVWSAWRTHERGQCEGRGKNLIDALEALGESILDAALSKYK